MVRQFASGAHLPHIKQSLLSLSASFPAALYPFRTWALSLGSHALSLFFWLAAVKDLLLVSAVTSLRRLPLFLRVLLQIYPLKPVMEEGGVEISNGEIVRVNGQLRSLFRC